MSGTLLPWFTAVGLQTVRDLNVYHRPPVPSEFVASGLVFGALTMIGTSEPQLAAALAWGFLAALVIQAYERSQGRSGILSRRVPAQEVRTTVPAGGAGGGGTHVGAR